MLGGWGCLPVKPIDEIGLLAAYALLPLNVHSGFYSLLGQFIQVDYILSGDQQSDTVGQLKGLPASCLLVGGHHIIQMGAHDGPLVGGMPGQDRTIGEEGLILDWFEVHGGKVNDAQT